MESKPNMALISSKELVEKFRLFNEKSISFLFGTQNEEFEENCDGTISKITKNPMKYRKKMDNSRIFAFFI